MDLSALIKAVLAPMESRISGDALRHLKPGDKLIGKVLSMEGDGRALVDLGPSRVLAQMTFAVKVGEPLNLQVVENDTVLHFRAEHPQAAAVRIPVPQTDFFNILTPAQQKQLVQFAERMIAPSDSGHSTEILPQNIIEAVSRVRALFESVPVDQPADKLVSWIKSAVEDQGVFFEKRLADLVDEISIPTHWEGESRGPLNTPEVLITRDVKPQLMIFKAFLDQAYNSPEAVLRMNPREVKFLRTCVENLLDHVNQQQARAVTRWESGAPQQVLVHLWPFQELRKPVELKIYYPPRKHLGEDTRRHRIAILLDMDRLGPVRADLSLIEGNLHIGFFVVSEELKTLLQKEMMSVEAALAGKFQQLRLDVFVCRERIERFHHEDLDAAATGGIDISA